MPPIISKLSTQRRVHRGEGGDTVSFVSPQYWMDRVAIEAVHARYFAALDRCDHEQVRSCFTTDLEARYVGVEPMHGLDAFMTLIGGFIADVERGSIKISTHFMGNFHMARVSGERAETEMPVVVYTVRPLDPGPGDTVTIRGIRYFDRLRKSGDEWLICERVHTVDWQCAAPASLAATFQTRMRSPWS